MAHGQGHPDQTVSPSHTQEATTMPVVCPFSPPLTRNTGSPRTVPSPVQSVAIHLDPTLIVPLAAMAASRLDLATAAVWHAIASARATLVRAKPHRLGLASAPSLHMCPCLAPSKQPLTRGSEKAKKRRETPTSVTGKPEREEETPKREPGLSSR